MAWPLSRNFMVSLAVTYRTVPSKLHPGIVLLFWLNSTSGLVAFLGTFDGRASKCGFCNRSVNKKHNLLLHITENLMCDYNYLVFLMWSLAGNKMGC